MMFLVGDRHIHRDLGPWNLYVPSGLELGRLPIFLPVSRSTLRR